MSSKLPISEDSYCRCLVHVAEKQTEECLSGGNGTAGKRCYSPYAVCKASTHSSTRSCFFSYNLGIMSDSELIALMRLHKLSIPRPFNRQEAVRILREKR